MNRRILAQLLVGSLLTSSVPGPRTAAEEDRPVWVPSSVASPLLIAPGASPAAAVNAEVALPVQQLAEGVEIQARPLVVPDRLRAPAASNPNDALPAIVQTTDRLTSGIERDFQRLSAGRSVQEVQSPEAPQAIVAHPPDEYAALAARAEEIALPVQPRLSVRPSVLRFALTQDGLVPAAQTLEISSDRRAGARFEVTASADWVGVEGGGGRAGLNAAVVQVTVHGRQVQGPLSAFLSVRNFDDPSDVQRIAVELEQSAGRPLRSYDADGRLQRVIRPDGGVLDYDYDARGQLIRVRRPDGSAATWSYDDLGRRIAMTDQRGTTVYRYDALGKLDTVYTPGFDPLRYGYDERSRLETLHLPGGRVVAYEYDEADRLLTVRGDLGTTRYEYDAVTQRLCAQVLPNGVATRYDYDADGRVTGLRHLSASGETLLAFTWSLDDQGRPVSVTRESAAGGETPDLTYTDFAYDAVGHVSSVASSSGSVTTYEYDSAGRRTRQIETAGSNVQITDYIYDQLGRLIQAGDENFVYDTAGNLAFRQSPGRTLEYRWDSEGGLTGFSDGQHEVAYSLDGDGRRVAVTVDGRESSFLQDASGWIGTVLAEANADGAIVRTYVHGYGVLAVEGKDGEGSYYLFEHPLRSAAALVAPSGTVAETFESDPFGTPRTPPDAALPPYLFAGEAYDPFTGLIHLDGAEYDPELGAFLPSPVASEDPDRSSRVRAAWGELSPPGAFSEALARAFRPDRPLAGDSRDEPTAGRSSGHDPANAMAETLHASILLSNELPLPSERPRALRRAVRSPYRPAPQGGAEYRREVVALARPSTTPPRLKLHPEYLPFAKTAAGLLPTSQTLEIASSDGGAISFMVAEDIPWLTVSATGGTAPAALTVTVDPSGLTEAGSPYFGDVELTNVSDPTDVRKVRVRLLVRATGASVILRSFDANGNLRRVVKPDGGVIDYEVDPLGRVTRMRYPDLFPVSYAYDGNGNRVSMTDHRGTTVYQYDRQNRVIGVLTPLGPNYIPVTYGYDNAGRLTTLSTPDGRTVLYQYDADGRLIRVTDGAAVTTYSYNPLSGLLASQVLPNGVTTAYAYDADGQLTNVVHNAPGGGFLMGFHYTLSALGQRTSVTKQTSSGSEFTAYNYDALGRIESVTYPDGKIVGYEYDALGNRLSLTTVQGGSATVVSYEYDKDNRLVRASDEIFQYDPNGNMIRRSSPTGTTTYMYDARNLLSRVETAGQVIKFEYDGDGNRIARDLNGLRTNFINDSSGDTVQALVEANASWQVLKSHSYGIGRIGQQLVGAQHYYLFDGKSVAALVDGTGVPEEVYSYDSFGRPSGTTTLNAYLFDGEHFDDELSLIYLRARYYDPTLGRFISKDPREGSVESPSTHAGYVYALNDPVNRIDPSGLDTIAIGLQGTGNYRGIQGVATGQLVIGIDTWNPLDWRIATINTVGGGVVSDPAGASLAVILSYSPDANSPTHDLTGPATYRGINAGGKGTVFGFDQTTGQNDVDIYSGFFGFGASSSRIPASIDYGFSNTVVRDDFSLREIGRSIGGWFDGLFGSTRSDLGGVSLNRTADLLLSLEEITGATFDEASGQIVLLGREDVALPPFDMNHVAVATQSVYGGQDPGVSIDPPIVNNQMSVRYEGQTRDTEFGDIMFEADRVLKILTLGKDNVTGQPVSSAVPGYKNLLQRRLAAGCGGAPTSTRMWFQPKEVRLVPSTDGQSMVFDAVSMELLYESKIGNQVVSDPVAAAFATHFTQNYTGFAAEWPILEQLEQLGKVVAIIKWIKDNHIPIDLSFLDNYPIEFFSTPTSTPTVTVQGSRQIGPVTCTVTLQGGVTYEVPNEYLPADPEAGERLSEALAERPSEETFKWTYQPSSGTPSGPVTAVAQSLTRSRRDGNVRFQEVDLTEPLTGGDSLALFRIYNSFLDRTGPLGPGWSVLPAELRFPVSKERFTFGSGNLALDLYARIWVTERTAEREDAFDLLGIDSDDLPVYRRADAMHVLRQQSDGAFRLTREDGSTATFRDDGKPLSLVDRNSNAVDFVYDTQLPERLLSLTVADGRTIALSYDAEGRLTQAAGPGGRQVLYGFDGQGRLATVTDFAGRFRSYGYDTTGRLASATDAQGRSIFAAGYDDYDRTPSRRLGAAAQYGLAFDLEAGKSTTVDPLGRISRQLYERRQLAAPSGVRNEVYRPTESEDPLGNRTTIAWADDAFGPRTVTDAQGAMTELSWDNRGHLTSILDPLDELTERFYDWRDRLVAVRDAEGLATGFGYDNRNNPTSVYHDVDLIVDTEGNLTSFFYDPANVSTFTYDPNGNVAAAANPLGQETQVENNGKGQPTRVTSPTGVETTLGYDTRSRLITSQIGGRQTTYGYDAADQISSVTTAAGMTSFLRDPQGRVTRLTDALSRSTVFSYDTDGRLTRVDDALDGVAIYSYDVLGNVLSANLPNGTTNAWEYDELGRPVAALTGLGPVAPALALTTDSLDFGTVPVGTSRDRALDLYNQGTAPLTISGITVSVPFSVIFFGPATIQPADSLQVTVTFTPTDQVPASANLSITSDDPANPLQLVALFGEGARRVANLQATPAQEGIQLTWSLFDPGSQPFGHFNVYRSLTPIPDDVTGLAPFDSLLTSPTATSFLDRLAVPGTSYHYAVTPVYANGDENKGVDPAGPVAFFTTFGPLAPDAGVATSAQSESRPASVYNTTADEYLVVYERQVSASDTDVYGQRVSATGSLLGGTFAIANTAGRHERRPRLAYNANSNNYLVIWEFDASGTGSNYNLRVRPVSAAGALGTVVNVAATARHELAPEIAFGSVSREYLVCYEWDGDNDGKIDLSMLRLSATGAFLGGVFVRMPGTSGVVDATNPQLAYNSTANEFMVAFERDLAGDGSNIELWETRFRPDLTLVVAQIFSVAQNVTHDRNPFLTYDPTHDEYLAVWETDETGTGVDIGIYSRKLTSVGALGGILFGLASRAGNPRAVYNPNLDDFVILWQEGGATPKIRARRVHFTINMLQTQSPVEVTSGITSRLRPDIGTSTVSNTFLVTWEEDAGSGNFDVRSRLLGTFAPALEVSPASLSFSGTTTQQALTISNANPSGGPLQWTATPDAGSPWMTAEPGFGSTTSSVEVEVAVDRTGLAPGTYPGTVHVASNDGDIDVPVMLIVGNTPPDAPSAPRPADGATDQASVSGGMDLAVGWQGGDADGDTVTWDVYLDTAPASVAALDPAVRIAQGLTVPSLQPAGLAFFTSYFWRVVALDSRGDSTAGPVWQFTTAAVPPPVLVPVIPDPTQETRPNMNWQTVTGAVSYHLQVADNADFSPHLIDAAGLTAASFTPASPLPEGTVYWRVQSFDVAGQPGAFSEPDLFVIDITAPGIPVLVPVTPDPTSDSQPVLSWNPVSEASSYRVQVAGEAGFTSPVVDATVSTLTYQSASSLPEGPIDWRVASLDEAGNQSPFAGPDHFTLDVTPPPAIDGLTAHRQVPGVDLTWHPLTGPPTDFARFRIYRAEAPFTNVTGVPLLDESLTSTMAVAFHDETATPGVAYWYAVTAVDTAGNEDHDVAVAHVVANEPPDQPVLVAPAVGAEVLPSETMTVSLVWSASDLENDPLRFEVYLSTDPAQVGGTPDITVRIADNLETPSFEALGLTYQNTYYWSVVVLDLAVDGSVRNATFGPLWSFAIPPIPAPVLTALAPDPTNQLRPTFTWQSVPGAAGYRIEIADDPAFGSTIVATEVTEPSFTPAADLLEGPLHWRVRAIDAQGLPGAFSEVDDFVLDVTAPSVPVLVPVTPDPTSNLRPDLGWGPVPDASSYRVQVSIDVDFGSLLTDVTVPAPPFVPGEDLPEGEVYWRVGSRDEAGNESGFSPADLFAIDVTAPAVPTLVPVSPDPTGQPRPALVWAVVADAVEYRIQIATEPSFSSPLHDVVVSENSWVPIADLPEGEVHWRVASRDGVGNESAFSPADSFVVDLTPPVVPVLVPVSPDPTGQPRPALAWAVVADAGEYRVQVATDSSFSSPLHDVIVSENNWVPIADLPEGDIYWRVASRDGAGNESAFSPADSFVVDLTPPAVPVLVPVSPDPTGQPRPALAWAVVVDAAEYRVQVATDPSFSSPLHDVIVSENSWIPSSDFPEGEVHWRVASRDGVGNESAFSPADSFVVDLTPPAVPVLVPVSPDPTGQPRPALAWAVVADAVVYRIQVGTDPSFSSVLYDVVISETSWTPTADLPEQEVYWRVASRDQAGNESAFSSADSFLVDLTAPAVPVLVPVSPDPTGEPRPNLAWEIVLDAVEYRVQVAIEETFSSPLHDVLVSESNWDPITDLPEGEIYWRVASRDEAGNESAFSPADVFVLDLSLVFADGFESGDTSAWSATIPPPTEREGTLIPEVPLLGESS